jgi:hypothetical protein
MVMNTLFKMKQLKKQITEQETGKEKITAKGIEAGLGKSIETNSIVTNDVNEHKAFGRKYCLVKPFISDVIRSTAFMNDNSKINGTIALGVTHENWDEIRQNLDQILLASLRSERGLVLLEFCRSPLEVG